MNIFMVFYVSGSTSELRVGLTPLSWFTCMPSSKIFVLTVPRRSSFVDHLCY